MPGDKLFAYAFLITLPLTFLNTLSDTEEARKMATIFFIAYFISSIVVLWNKDRAAKGK